MLGLWLNGFVLLSICLVLASDLLWELGRALFCCMYVLDYGELWVSRTDFGGLF